MYVQKKKKIEQGVFLRLEKREFKNETIIKRY